MDSRRGYVFLEARVTGVCKLPNMGAGIQTLDLIIEQQGLLTANLSLQICFYQHILVKFFLSHITQCFIIENLLVLPFSSCMNILQNSLALSDLQFVFLGFLFYILLLLTENFLPCILIILPPIPLPNSFQIHPPPPHLS